MVICNTVSRLFSFDRLRKRRQQYFKKLQECRQWLANAQFEDKHGNSLQGENPTVDTWFNYWIENIKGQTIRDNTKICMSMLQIKKRKYRVLKKCLKSFKIGVLIGVAEM